MRVSSLSRARYTYADALCDGCRLPTRRGRRKRRLHPQHTPQVLGAHTMPKEIKNKREDKKKPAMTPKEKKEAKRAKKEGKLAASA